MTLLSVIVLVFSGCKGTVRIEGPKKGNELLTVDFQKGQTLRYKFVSSKNGELNWGSTEKDVKRGKNVVSEFSELLNIVVAYRPIEVNSYGTTTIQATIESVEAKRSGRDTPKLRDTKDAVETLAGKSFTFTVQPTGQIEDYSQMNALIKEAGKKAFRTKSKMGRVKEPDMVRDFVATQWFLWDSVSSIKEPLKGVGVGQSWNSQLSIPVPMVMKAARNVSYTLAKIEPTAKGRVAEITSSYSPAETAARKWPLPYEGRFQIADRFGLLRHFQVLNIRGSGKELFNIDKGRTERYTQNYKVEVSASFPLPLAGANPRITIEQKLSMRLLNK